MRTHLEDDVLLDVIEGSASVEAARHVEECSECGGRVAEARAGFSLAAAADAPDPSPLFWEHFQHRVASRIDAERPARRFGGFLAPALLATAATVAVLSFVPRPPASLVVSPAPIAAAPALPGGEETADTVAASVDDLGCQDVAGCIASLTDEESRALADALRAELAETGDLGDL